MANLNLSQFTEKLFVADADHTFIWDTVGAISKRVSRNSWLNSGTLTSDAPVTISQTWNGTVSTVFTALKVNATSTASDPTSKLLDLQVGGVSQFNVRKSGQALFSSGIVSAPGITFLSGSNTGIWETSAGVHFSSAGTNAFGIRNEIRVNSSLAFGFASGTPADTGLDVALWRDAANTLALRNGANAQTFNVYGTYTSGTSYERLTLSAPSAANAIIGTNKGSGGGTARGLDFQTDGVSRWSISTAGHLLAAADNTYDIGASGASRPRNVYVGTAIVSGNNVSSLDYYAGSGGVTRSYVGGGGGVFQAVSTGYFALCSSATNVFTQDTFLSRNAAGVWQMGTSSTTANADLRLRSVIQQPPATITPALNGDFVVEATSNTTLTFKLKGTDGTVRSGTITLA